MKRITNLLLILAVILALTSCATFQSLTGQQSKQLTIHFADGDIITYELPAAFPEMDEDQLEYVPIYYGYAVVVRQVIGDNIYGVVLGGPDAVILGAGMFIDEQDTWWIYVDGKPNQLACTRAEMDAHIEKWVMDLMAKHAA